MLCAAKEMSTQMSTQIVFPVLCTSTQNMEVVDSYCVEIEFLC